MLTYHVAHLFAHEGKVFTNQPSDLALVKGLPRKVRDHHIERGNLVETGAEPDGATTTKKE